MNENNTPDWILVSISAIVIGTLIGTGVADYISYLTVRQQNETIRAAISNNWSIEQIQGLINSRQ